MYVQCWINWLKSTMHYCSVSSCKYDSLLLSFRALTNGWMDTSIRRLFNSTLLIPSTVPLCRNPEYSARAKNQ